MRVARKLLLRFDGFSCQIQERSRRARRDELFSRSNDQDSDAGTFRRNVAVRRRVLISADVELDIEESESIAQSFTYQGRPLTDPGSERKSVEAARRGGHRRDCGREVVQHDVESE